MKQTKHKYIFADHHLESTVYSNYGIFFFSAGSRGITKKIPDRVYYCIFMKGIVKDSSDKKDSANSCRRCREMREFFFLFLVCL